MNKVFYRDGFKSHLANDFTVSLPFKIDKAATSEYINLTTVGLLSIKKGYAWDGASGIAVNTKNFVRGALIHDALYQLMREGLLPDDFRNTADDVLRQIIKEDGMSSIRAWWVYRAVRSFGESSASIENMKEVKSAP